MLAVPALLLGGGLLAAACGGTGASAGSVKGVAASYTPQTRNFTVSIVPLVVHEQAGYLPYLQKEFAAGGLLADKEVYGYYPSTLVVYQGDTVHINWVNTTNDPHINVLAAYGVDVTQDGTSTAQSSFVANKVGVFTFLCAEAEHNPYMYGQLLVLPASAAPQGAGS